jgi:GNAT superfamily N-acetyltransferase
MIHEQLVSFPDVESIAYNLAPESLRREIDVLQALAYGPHQAEGGDAPLHDPALNAQSCFIRCNGQVISYAGVVTKTVQHAGQLFVVSGLSCVATDPAYRRQGLARRVVATATSYMAHSGVDFGVFTCAPELVPLYARVGSWMMAPGVRLIGSRHAGALTSESLGVAVLMRLFSARAHAAAMTLLRGTIDLDLPDGQFW